MRSESGVQRGSNLIFVTVGTHNKPFDRLIQAADHLAAESKERVIVQTGTSALPLMFAEGLAFFNKEEMDSYLELARIVVSHGGAGTILTVLKKEKPLVIVPRLKQFGEVSDDHQVELAEALHNKGLATLLEEQSYTNLRIAIARVTKPKCLSGGQEGLAESLRAYLKTLDL